MQTYCLYNQLETFFWRAYALSGKRKNGRDQARFRAAMISGALMTTGHLPSRKDEYAAEWHQFLGTSSQMLSQSTPPFFARLLALSSECQVTKNLIEFNSIQAFTENSLLMSLVSLLFSRTRFNNLFKFGSGTFDAAVLTWPGWESFAWKRVDGQISDKFKGYLKNLQFQI